VEETLQQVLEAEMDEALQASKGERTAGSDTEPVITTGCW
jgi:transposase-like protein